MQNWPWFFISSAETERCPKADENKISLPTSPSDWSWLGRLLYPLLLTSANRFFSEDVLELKSILSFSSQSPLRGCSKKLWVAWSDANDCSRFVCLEFICLLPISGRLALVGRKNRSHSQQSEKRSKESDQHWGKKTPQGQVMKSAFLCLRQAAQTALTAVLKTNFAFICLLPLETNFLLNRPLFPFSQLFRSELERSEKQKWNGRKSKSFSHRNQCKGLEMEWQEQSELAARKHFDFNWGHR